MFPLKTAVRRVYSMWHVFLKITHTSNTGVEYYFDNCAREQVTITDRGATVLLLPRIELIDK